MVNTSKRTSIGTKMYIFLIATVLFVAAGVCAIAYAINADQIDTYFKRLTVNNAMNYATLADKDFLVELRAVAESDEYQALRDKAEEEENEEIVIEYLQSKGLWDKYVEEREKMRTYVENMQDIEYLYIVAWGKEGTNHDMYVIDSDDVEVYETGYFEEREAEFEGVDPTQVIQPVINNGDWGWLCSGYVPVYDDDGNLLFHVGCDISMEDVMSERRSNLYSMITYSLGLTALVMIGALIFANKSVVSPLNRISNEMKKFLPEAGKNYEETGVIGLKMRGNDEITEIHDEIRSMQKRIIDYINDITAIRIDKEKAEDYIKHKDKELGEISREAFKDALTGIGNKNAYTRRISEIDAKLKEGPLEFAIVMMDANGLKNINDLYGHSAGDAFLKGCCHVICEVFKHSPVYRIGGDEFVAILTGEDYINREERISELRKAFDEAYGRDDLEPWERFSASAGMAEFTADDKSAEEVFKRADKAMYDDKEKFKNNN
ncbi:diguanylate cyclase (GGDEF) domain-containing protein [Ruminococcaceae bacterium YRB3002]|nr:diguanylate cyclase (GGDEF) domain-containing protein [Ruminococcaceae bacterium YRB3002]